MHDKVYKNASYKEKKNQRKKKARLNDIIFFITTLVINVMMRENM